PAAKETAPPKAVKLADVFNFSQISRSIGGCIMAVVRHHRRHVMRMPVKSLLVVGMALLFVAALGWLDATITFTENEIARLHETTLVTGEVREVGAGMADDMWGQNIPHESITALRESGFVDTYYMTVINRGIGIFPPMEWEEGTLDWNIFRSYQALALGPAPVPIEDIAKTFSCWDIFMEDITRPVEFGVGMDTEFILEFAPGYGVEDFVIEFERVYEGEEYSYVLHTIPVIVHESLLERDLIIYAGGVMYYEPFFDAEVTHQRLSLGDYAYLGSAAMNPNHTPVKIIGIYRGGHPRTAYRGGRGLILAPYGLWGGTVATFEFTISQDMVPYLPEFEREMAERLLFTRYNEWEQEFAGETITHVWTQDFAHELVLNDAELTMVVGPLENNLHLLRILYPVAVGLSFVLALGLSLLLMLQNAKNAAVMRVLGMPRHRTRLNLCMELLAVCMAGLVPGLIAVLIMGVGIATAALLVGLYLAGAVIGTVAGVIVISQKAPMELLQVRE
ncbi:MAG: hypothetical protein FWC32_08350, partial [Firmicutes bacterium]|nr:hypothetical protein [Bacillota bacterium]